MLADHLGQLEAVQLGHADIDQDDRHLRLQQIGQCLAGGGHRDEILVQLRQHDFVAQKLARLVVHQKDIDAFALFHGRAQRCNHMRSADSSCSVLTGLAR